MLLIEQTSHRVCKVWVEAVALKERPEAIVWFEDSSYIAKDSSGPMNKGIQKEMLKLGYQASFWHLRLDDHGAALVQSKLLLNSSTDKPSTILGNVQFVVGS